MLNKVKQRTKRLHDICNELYQRFSTDGTRTPRGTSAVAKGYAGKNIANKIFFRKTANTSTFLLLALLLLRYSMFCTN